MDLHVTIGGLVLRNPVMPASGTFAEGLERVIDLDLLGALVTKTVTRECRSGNPLPRVAETASGMLNSIGIPSNGFAYFRDSVVPRFRCRRPPLVVSVSAPTPEAFAEDTAELASIEGVAAIEANISCPNLEDEGRTFAANARATAAVVRRIRAATRLPLWVKLTPNVSDIAEVARAAEMEGADALVVANTLLGMAIDVQTWRPRLGNVLGGLSGPAVKPVVVRMVYQCAKAVRIPIVGCGGISNTADAIEYMLAGASAVQVGTATFIEPPTMIRIIEGIGAYCQERGLERIDALIGGVHAAPAVAH